MKMKKQEVVKNIRDMNTKLQVKIEKLMDKREHNKEIVEVKINSKKQVIQKLNVDMTQMKLKCDEEIQNLM